MPRHLYTLSSGSARGLGGCRRGVYNARSGSKSRERKSKPADRQCPTDVDLGNWGIGSDDEGWNSTGCTLEVTICENSAMIQVGGLSVDPGTENGHCYGIVPELHPHTADCVRRRIIAVSRRLASGMRSTSVAPWIRSRRNLHCIQHLLTSLHGSTT